MIHSPCLATPSEPRLLIPNDLRCWIGEEALLTLVLEAVAVHSAGRLPKSLPGELGEPPPTALLLAVLTYSYLTGRVASEQVEEAMHFDAVLRRLHGDRRFEAAALRRFRRSTRGALSVCLFRTLRMAMRQPGARAVRDKWQVEDSTLLCACAAKAEQVLEAAVRADTLAMDV